MYPLLFISILLSRLQINTCNYLEAESNYQKPKLERNNVVNKGVWVRNKFRENLFEKTSLGNVIFRPSSLDADRLLQTDFDAFAGNLEENPFVSSYLERVRRSPDEIRKRHARKGMKKLKNIKSIDEKSTNSNLILNIKKPSLFNGYPNEAPLPNKNETKMVNNKEETHNETNNVTTNEENTKVNATTLPVRVIINVTEATVINTDVSPPKRSKKHNYGIDNNEQMDIFRVYNKTNQIDKMNRDILLNKDDRIWHQNAPIPDTNIYEVVPKDQTKGVSERGLIKVISMLTKTFKKIMKQHHEIKFIYDKFNTANEDFLKQVNEMNMKFQDLDSKYSDIIQFNEKLKSFEGKLANEEQFLKTKHKEMETNVAEFENQQTKFLNQQRQFFNVQKVMLAQNEKINNKQSAIAKTQSEISHRQNNFARILKKAKQLFMDNKKANFTKPNNDNPNTTIHNKPVQTTTESVAESVKLNLFSISPKTNIVANHDEMILKEKDEKPVDDIVYKYYFNNTFIDSLMKSKILNDYATNTNSIDIARNIKNKRDGIETTILLPINTSSESKNRVRRWIDHFKDKGLQRKPRQDQTKILKTELVKNVPNAKGDPFLTMARSFCNEIGQNTNEQALHWCIEKALRRLRFMDKKLFSRPVTMMKEKSLPAIPKVAQEKSTVKPGVTLIPVAPSTVWMTSSAPISTTLYAVPQEIFFPDNDELESNLKQFDLTPDTEGTVYYDGSLHYSDIGHIAHDSDGMSDFMPGLVDSNSKVEMNPMAFDLQAKRRAYVNRLNEDIMKKFKPSKL